MRGTWARRLLPPIGGVAATLAAFELASRTDLLPRHRFPPVTEVFAELGDLAGTAAMWEAVRDTLDSWARAMVIAAAVGIPLGLAMGASRAAATLLRLVVDFLRPIPSVALIPILIPLYGTRPTLTIALAAFGATFPLLFQAMYGVADVDPVADDTVRGFGLDRWARLRQLVLPTCAPYLATGLRISASVALILVVTGQYVAAVPGVGQEVFVAQSSGSYDRMYAYVVVAGLLGLAVNLGFHAVERRVLFWHPSQRIGDDAAVQRGIP
jgi:ABC-type nitrate/sulfonate/bicarbonate transport system permease component